ncbi:MAG: hypothetical protein AAGI10_03995 [Pseudomonadota bacterium]
MQATVPSHVSGADRAILFSPFGLVLIAGALLVATVLSGGPRLWPTEDGAFEWISFLSLLCIPVVFFAIFPADTWLKASSIPVYGLLLAMREGETDWWIIDERLLGAEFYAEQGLSLTAIAGGAIVLLLALATVTLLWKGVPALFRALIDRRAWAILLVVGGVVAVVAQSLEEVEPLAAELSSTLGVLTIVAEEVLEMVFCLCLLEAVLRGGRPLRLRV